MRPSETPPVGWERQPVQRCTVWQLLRAGASCIKLAGQQDGNQEAETLEYDRVKDDVTAVPDASGLSGWHKMQSSQQHSGKWLGLREPLEDKMKDSRLFLFHSLQHQSVEEIQTE